MFVPRSIRTLTLYVVAPAAAVPWLLTFRPERWITWKESQINSDARRAWTSEAAAYLGRHYRPGEVIFTGSGDVNGIFRAAGIPLRQTLSVDNGLLWDAAIARPDLFLRTQWVIAVLTPSGRSDGDRVRNALDHPRVADRAYELLKKIESRDGKVIEIYRRNAWFRSDRHTTREITRAQGW